MAEILALWHAEHAKFARLLQVFDGQLAAFHDGEEPDYELMRDIVEYLTKYADAFHHPREDAGFARLVARDASFRTEVARLTQEHRVLANAGKALFDRLEEIVAGAIVPRDALESAAATYFGYYRAHLGREEQVIMPACGRLLTAEDWNAIAHATVAGRDPLFGDDVDVRFKELRRRILRHESAA